MYRHPGDAGRRHFGARCQLLCHLSGQRAELELSGARTRLKTLLGRGSSPGDVDLTDELAITPSVEALELQTLSQKAFASRPDLRALELGQVRAQSDIRLQIANGIGYLSEDRKRYGLALGLDVETNAVMAALRKFLGLFGSVNVLRTRAVTHQAPLGALAREAGDHNAFMCANAE